MNCTNCGAEVKADDVFCSKCGTRLTAGSSDAKKDTAAEKKEGVKNITDNDMNGWDYLVQNEIKDMECDMQHNYAFVSYAHVDQEIVNSVFKTLTERGYNLWIDTANMPYDSKHWKESAESALVSENCRLLLYFRSEESITKRTIADEISTFAKYHDNAETRIIVVEIYNDDKLHTKDFRKDLIRIAEESGSASDKNRADCCNDICNIVSESCKAFQLKSYKNVEAMCCEIEDELACKNILQRFSLPNKIAYIMDGSFNIKPQGDQLNAFNIFSNMVNSTLGENGDGKKRTLIIEGSPGTGKSVLMMYMLSWLRSKSQYRDKRIKWVSKNNAPRRVYEENLKAEKQNIDKKSYSQMKKDFKEIFCGQLSIKLLHDKKDQEDVCDIMFIDEAHRLESFNRYAPGIDMAELMFNSAKITVVMVDDEQVVTTADSGDKKHIYEWAERSGAEIRTAKLQSQLRCRGSDSYLNWIKGLLGIVPENKYLAKTSDYDLRVFDDPQTMYNEIREKNKSEKPSRLLAGYCWEWLSDGRDDTNVHDITIGDFGISWNFQSGKPYASDEGSIDQAGCVHTTQGLEFKYVGVIFGDDIRYENGKIVTDISKRAKTDGSKNGLNTIKKNDPQKAEELADRIIRNTYQVLMTRGVKGCYIYCVDRALNEYMHKCVDQYNSSKV